MMHSYLMRSTSTRTSLLSQRSEPAERTCVTSTWSELRYHRAQASSSRVKAEASSSGSSDSSGESLTAEEARKYLGLPRDATFEQTLQAKNKMLGQAGGDTQRQMQIETAYDILLMRSMKARISGELQPARDVRYADVPKYRPAVPRKKTWQDQVREKIPARVQQPPEENVVVQGVIFGTLAASILLQEFLLEPQPGVSNMPSLQIGLAFGASIYFLRDAKRLSLVRAVGLTTAGLFVGTLLGSALQSWLRVELVPIGGLHSPAILVGEFSVVGIWLASFLLA